MTDAVNDPNPNNEESAVGQTILLDSGDTPAPVVTPPVTPPVVDEATPVQYEATGDVGLDMTLAFVGKAGLAADHPAMQAAMVGDFTILKATLAQKGVAGWEQFVALGEAAYTRTQEAAKAKDTALVSMVHKVAGGAEQWAQVQGWAKQNATPQERAEINGLLNQGGLAAKGAVQYLVDAYNRASNVEVNPVDPVANARPGAAASANGPLSATEYASEVAKLNAKLRGRLEGSKEYESLQRRRAQAVRR